MPYSNAVTFFSLEGGTHPPLQADLWIIEHFTQGHPSDIEVGTETLTIPAAGQLTLVFQGGPGFQNQGRSIGLSIQEASGVPTETGWWFRSGRFASDLPAAPIEVVLPGAVRFTPAALAGVLPTVPFTARATTVTGVTATPMADGTITLGLTGTAGTSVITYTRSFVPSISASISDAATDAFDLEANGPATLTAVPPLSLYAIGSPNPENDINTAVVPLFKSGLKTSVVTSALGLLASAGMIGAGATALPAGVVLSIRKVVVTPAGVAFMVALAGFGGVFSKLPPTTTAASPPPAPAPAPSKCFIATAAGAGAPEVTALQDYRDGVLRQSSLGRIFVAIYESASPPVAAVIRAHPRVRRAVQVLIVRPCAAYANWRMRHQ